MASNYQNEVKRFYEKQGYKVLKIIRLSENGYPDLILLKDGRTSFIECKESNDTLKPLQQHRINELITMGFEAVCMQKGKGVIFGQTTLPIVQ